MRSASTAGRAETSASHIVVSVVLALKAATVTRTSMSVRHSLVAMERAVLTSSDDITATVHSDSR